MAIYRDDVGNGLKPIKSNGKLAIGPNCCCTECTCGACLPDPLPQDIYAEVRESFGPAVWGSGRLSLYWLGPCPGYAGNITLNAQPCNCPNVAVDMICTGVTDDAWRMTANFSCSGCQDYTDPGPPPENNYRRAPSTVECEIVLKELALLFEGFISGDEFIGAGCDCGDFAVYVEYPDPPAMASSSPPPGSVGAMARLTPGVPPPKHTGVKCERCGRPHAVRTRQANGIRYDCPLCGYVKLVPRAAKGKQCGQAGPGHR